MPGYKKPMMAHKDKPMMGHEPKMAHGNKPQFNDQLKADAKAGKLDKSPKFKEMVLRAKMATPKMVDNKNFPKMAQDMAKALIPKMDHAKMYKPTKYHDMPKMAHGDKPKMYGKPKMMAGDGKHTGKVVTIGGKKYDTRSSEYKALTSKKQAGKAQGANYIGGSKDGKPVTK
jgi:hypothetical protein